MNKTLRPGIILLISPDASVRQILGRPGEIWGSESSSDKLILIRIDCEL